MDFKTYALIAALLLVATNIDSQSNNEWVQYQSKFGKRYADEFESIYRQAVFYQNELIIAAHNADETQTYRMRVNQFADMTEEEFQERMLTRKSSRLELPINETPKENVGDVNWVTRGGVTGVKDQGNCGSCWSFSAAAQVESEKFVNTQTLTQFSEQQLCDCDTAVNSGCNGGFEYYGINYYAQNGICTEASYPYQSGGGSSYSCRQSSCTKDSFKISGYNLFSGISELQNANEARPIAVAVDAGRWSLYGDGIFSNCRTSLNHAVLLAGHTQEYWLVKNSWGPYWGEDGYIRLKGNANTCGIAREPSHAVV